MLSETDSPTLLADVAFEDSQRTITYAEFSRDIAAVSPLLTSEFPSGLDMLGISQGLGPYLHWVLHAACTIQGIPTLAMRANQGCLEDITVAGPLDPTHSGPSWFFDMGVLAKARQTVSDDNGQALADFRNSARERGDTVNRFVLTSGSTGRPKVVPVTNAKLLLRTEFLLRHWNLTSKDRFLTTMGRDTISGLQFAMLPLLIGGSVIMFMGPGMGVDRLIPAIEASTFLSTTPHILESIIRSVGSPMRGAAGRRIVTGGSRINLDLYSKCARFLGSTTTSVYGSTEAGIVSEIIVSEQLANFANAGALCDRVDIKLGIDEQGGEVSIPAPIRIRTPWMAEGYWENGTIHPFPDGWFSPGDLGYLNEQNELIITGREDDRLNFRGNKFDAVAVESRLKSVEGIQDAFISVVTVEHKDYFVVMAVSDMRQSDLKAVVRSIVKTKRFFLFMSQAIPRNHMGKIERSRLTAFCQDLVAKHLSG